jgi:hypothetical protein
VCFITVDLHLSCRDTSSVLYYSVFLLLLVVMFFPASTGYCLSCASCLKDVFQVRSWFLTRFNVLAVFVPTRRVAWSLLVVLCVVLLGP